MRPHGLGKMYKDNGGIYIGEFKNGAAHGKGSFVFADGSFYRGDFDHNKAESIDGEYQSATLKYSGDVEMYLAEFYALTDALGCKPFFKL